MNRKDFIKTCGLVSVGATTLSVLMDSCKTIFYAPNIISGNRIVIKRSDLAQTNSTVIKNNMLQAPIYLTKLNEQEYSAVLMYCTHKGCELNPAGNNLICPCHGSEFSTTGKVLNPPADKDLQHYSVTSDNENIYIQL
jgi:cytochrome b6-f complex iron-sulfur subunit